MVGSRGHCILAILQLTKYSFCLALLVSCSLRDSLSLACGSFSCFPLSLVRSHRRVQVLRTFVRIVWACPNLQRTEDLKSSNFPKMSPTLAHLALPHTPDENFVHIISDLLTPAECAALIQEHSTSLIPQPLTLTRRLREIFDDEELAETLWNRLRPFYGGMRIVDEDGCSWTASRLNTRFRLAKYERGWSFSSNLLSSCEPV
jgi:hypothetical protein